MQIVEVVRKSVGIFVFIILQIIFLPLTILGFMIAIFKPIYVSRKMGVSSTAIDVLYVRCMMHIFNQRKDGQAYKLLRCLPNASAFGMWLFLFPWYIKYVINSKVPTIAKAPKEGYESVISLVSARTPFFDRIIKKHLNSIEQFVFMGAGYDTRSFTILQNKGKTIYELDQKKTQRSKIEGIKAAGLDPSFITFVPIDFSNESWVDKPKEAGFDTSKKTMFLWEGVTPYLKEKDVLSTLKGIHEISAPGSILAFDVYSHNFVTGDFSWLVKKAKDLFAITNEKFLFGLNMSGNYKAKLEQFLNIGPYELGEYMFFGHQNKQKEPFMVAFECIVTKDS